METSKLHDLNKLRKPNYQKSVSDESFLLNINKCLQKEEEKTYTDHPNKHPFLFVYGLPRSGTTLLAQFVCSVFRTGYISNFAARFWLAPITGIRLSSILCGDYFTTDYQSTYAATKNMIDIHEFGYFWRYWLKKEKIEDYFDHRKTEKIIEWNKLRLILLNIQHEFGRPTCMKNLFGSFHIEKFAGILQNCLFIQIERNPLDIALSILEARKKYYSDVNTWWSIIPQEYPKLKDLPYMEQIAGQVYYLEKYYEEQYKALGTKNIIKIQYESLCTDPENVISRICKHCLNHFNYSLNPILKPLRFSYRDYKTHPLRNNIRTLIERFSAI